VSSELFQDVGHSVDRRLHVFKCGRKAEAEAHPVTATVGMNVGRGERRFDGAGVR
jgi:hypothetical protein